MVNESLVQSTEHEIRLIPRADGDCAFRLAAVGGVMVEARFAGGQVKHLSLHAKYPYTGRVVLPDGMALPVSLKAAETACLV
jgi:hypothetical protein